jgi:hypothetical protein
MTEQALEVLACAADIRVADPDHTVGAAALAERLIEAGWTNAGTR